MEATALIELLEEVLRIKRAKGYQTVGEAFCAVVADAASFDVRLENFVERHSDELNGLVL